ncbi:MAG: RsmE family RNA methyltransferase [Candidatus Omnitrophota bacterium]|nr:RsmE family RNA methyltransferase [Candidatus Omnitrophota bacterium]
MRIYCPRANIIRDRITILDPGQIHHLSSVRRLKKGDQVLVFDGKSREYECLIDSIAKNKVELSVLRLRSGLMVSVVEPSVGKVRKAMSAELALTLACALPKKVKMDYIIEKTVDLGVDRIIPIKTERTIVKYSPEKAKEKLKRWQAIAVEASKQCGRIKLPEIEPISEFSKVVSQVKNYELAVIPHLGPGNKSLKEVFCDFITQRTKPSSIIIFIGPEGDFSPREIKSAKENGCIGASLGDLVLKVDTAAISVVAFLRLFTS